MQGIIGNTKDYDYLIKLGYKVWRNDRAGNIVFDKHSENQTKRVAFRYPEGIFCVIHYDLELRPIGKMQEHRIVALREKVFD